MNRKVIYRVCPYCGKSIARCLPRHLNSHNKTIQDYCLDINNLTEVPKCKNPECDNLVSVSSDPTSFNSYCSPECLTKHRLLTGEHQFLKSNRKVDEEGNDLILKGMVDRGTHPFLSKNRVLLDDGRDKLAVKSITTRTMNGTNPFSKENAIKYNIREKSRESQLSTLSFNGRVGTNKPAKLYIGYFKDENLIKIGVTRNLDKRILCYNNGGITFDELKVISGIESDLYILEKELKLKYKDYYSPLDKVKYPNPQNTYMTLGHTEWYSGIIKDELFNK